jgi:glutamine amidotransferase
VSGFMIAVIDYGAGNLRSVVRALHHVGATLHITDDPAVVAAADGVVLPGVGATRDTMTELERRGLLDVIPQVIHNNTPFLGVCVGMQVLATASEEFGEHACLNIVPGVVRRLPASAGKVPQIGWNQVRYTRPHPLLHGIPDNTDFYFVHSFRIDTPARDIVVGETEYGAWFPSIIAQGSMFATQFHPEKSGRWGLQLYSNFVALVEQPVADVAVGREAMPASLSFRRER